jgi:hypothetical protein
MAKAKTKEKKPEVKQEAAIVRPEQLAKELGVSGKQIRAWLRTTFTDHEKRTSWLLTAKQAEAVRTRFTASNEEDGESE